MKNKYTVLIYSRLPVEVKAKVFFNKGTALKSAKGHFAREDVVRVSVIKEVFFSEGVGGRYAIFEAKKVIK